MSHQLIWIINQTSFYCLLSNDKRWKSSVLTTGKRGMRGVVGDLVVADVQLTSSEPSWQSLSPSQTHCLRMQRLFEHCKFGRKKDGCWSTRLSLLMFYHYLELPRFARVAIALAFIWAVGAIFLTVAFPGQRDTIVRSSSARKFSSCVRTQI